MHKIDRGISWVGYSQDFGLTRILYIIFVLKFTEPEAKVKYSKIFIRVRIVVVLLSRAKRLTPAPVIFLRLRLGAHIMGRLGLTARVSDSFRFKIPRSWII